jgi:mono/diheme cytochrome c family protein
MEIDTVLSLRIAALWACAVAVLDSKAESLVEQGRALAEANCGRCHNLDKAGDSAYPSPTVPDHR